MNEPELQCPLCGSSLVDTVKLISSCLEYSYCKTCGGTSQKMPLGHIDPDWIKEE